MTRAKTLVIITLALGQIAASGPEPAAAGAAHPLADLEATAATLEASLATDGLRPAKRGQATVSLAWTHYRLAESPDSAAKHPDALLDAHTRIGEAKTLKLKSSDRASLVDLESLMGDALFNRAAKASADQDREAARDYWTLAAAYRDDHTSHAQLAFAHHDLHDKAAALAAANSAIARYSTRPSELSADGMPETFLLAATLEPVVATGLATADSGLKLFPDNAGLQRGRLAVYQQHPELYEDAVKAYQAHIDAHPRDLTAALDLADMQLRKGHEAKAMKVAAGVLKLNPATLRANAMLATHHLAAADRNAKAADGGTGETDVLRAKATADLRAAYPYLKACHEAEPDNGQWVDQLVAVTAAVPELGSEHAGWEAKRTATNGE